MTTHILINGVSLNKTLIDLADRAVRGMGDGRISLEDAKLIIEKLQKVETNSDVSVKTVCYIKQHYHWTNLAMKWFNCEYGKINSFAKLSEN